MSTGEIVETVVGCVTGLTVIGALCAREAIKRGWVRFSLSLAVVPLEKRGTVPAETLTAPKVIPGTVIDQGRSAA